MVAIAHTGTVSGVEAQSVDVEICQSRGLPGFDIVGLPHAALRESRVRVMAAIANSGLQLPDRHFVVNLAPADLRKSGASFDLAIAIALLAACDLCQADGLQQTLLLGELALDGRLRSVRGVLAQLRSARSHGWTTAIIPREDAAWSALVPDMRVRVANHLREVVDHFGGTDQLPLSSSVLAGLSDASPAALGGVDLQDVIGQETGKRALEVAAAGRHNLIMVGPPGAGKTMLASRLPGLLPPPTADEALEIATIASVAGTMAGPERGWTRPFRAPHHSCSEAALVGGGHPIKPGEVTLAHRGVLFLDEIPEFRRVALEALRPTMESGVAVIVRARECVMMPAVPLLVAAMNPCPCGYADDPKRMCRCSYDQVERYRARVSGPLVDRFDLHVQLSAVPVQSLADARRGASSEQVRARVIAARAHADERRRSAAVGEDRRDDRALDAAARSLLLTCIDKLGLSLRAYHKVLRVAHTLADLDGSDPVHKHHVAEAVQYRVLDRDPNARLDLGANGALRGDA
ncbi:MAG: YifB family Mg chelatase-like AAA ATPase [Polyangiales bacterium]